MANVASAAAPFRNQFVDRLLRQETRRGDDEDYDQAKAKPRKASSVASINYHDAIHVPKGRETHELFIHSAKIQVGRGEIQQFQDIPVYHLRARSVL